MKTLTHNNSGKVVLADTCQKILISDVGKQIKKELETSLLTSQIEIAGVKLQLLQSELFHGGRRLWFACPLCQQRAGIIYQHPSNSLIGCRKCLRVDYKSRRFKGMIENSP